MSHSHTYLKGSGSGIYVISIFSSRDHFVYCLILSSDDTGEDTGLSLHTSWMHSVEEWQRSQLSYFSQASTHTLLSHLFSLIERSHHQWSAKAKDHRPKAEGSKTELIFISQMLAPGDWKKLSKAINLLSWAWCVGNLTRMFSDFNYSPKSQSPARIKSYFKVKWSGDRNVATWEITDMSAHNRNDCFQVCIGVELDAVCSRSSLSANCNNNSIHIQIQTPIILAAG